MGKGLDHRNKAKTGRNGRTPYEKGRSRYKFVADKKLIKGKKGSDTHNPELATVTLADVWPNTE